MPSRNINESLQDAGIAASNLAGLISSIQGSYDELKGELELLRHENSTLKEKLQSMKSENRALHLVRDRLVAERAADKETIRAWQNQLNETIPPSEASTQEAPAINNPIPSSPPTNRDAVAQSLNGSNDEQQLVDSLSQRVLPMSIGISDAGEEQNIPGTQETQDHSPIKQQLSSENSGQSLDTPPHDSMKRSAIETGPGHEKNADWTMKKRRNISQNTTNLDNSNWFVDKEWHPADFKLNPNYDPSKTVGANIGIERNQIRRKCMHGTDCPDCSNFYVISGIVGAAQAGSRHRFALDKQETPPGFWEMDFPESSQLSAEKLEMHEKALNDGRERLAEALIGGRYLFKDEALNKKVRMQLDQKQ